MRHFTPPRFSLLLHRAAKAELDALMGEDSETGAAIASFLQEAKENQAILDSLTRNGFVNHEEPKYDVKEWVVQRGARRNLWRVRHWSVNGVASRYRIVYAFHPVEFRYYVLAIVPRDFNYDSEHEVTKRILSVYATLNIPNY